eukprot:UN03914
MGIHATRVSSFGTMHFFLLKLKSVFHTFFDDRWVFKKQKEIKLGGM